MVLKVQFYDLVLQIWIGHLSIGRRSLSRCSISYLVIPHPFFFIFFELKGTRELLKGKREMIKMHEELLCKWIYHTYYITKKLLVLNFLEKYKNAYTFGEVLLWNSLFFYVRKGYHAIYIIQQVSKREWNVSILPLDIGGRTNKTSW